MSETMAPRLKRAIRPARLTRPLGLAVVSATALALFTIDRAPSPATAQEATAQEAATQETATQETATQETATQEATTQEAARQQADRDQQREMRIVPVAPRNVAEAPLAGDDPQTDAAIAQDAANGTAPAARTLAIPAGAVATAPGSGATVDNGAFVVHVDHAKVVRLPERTQTVIVGNPIIADVTVQRNGILVVTGKSFGSTNMIALDSSGALLAESMISVQAPQDSVVTVQRGLSRESYSCTPTCQPSLQLGDNPGFFDGVGAQATQRNELATRP